MFPRRVGPGTWYPYYFQSKYGDTTLCFLFRVYSVVHICTKHACGVSVVSLEHGALVICKLSVCT